MGGCRGESGAQWPAPSLRAVHACFASLPEVHFCVIRVMGHLSECSSIDRTKCRIRAHRSAAFKTLVFWQTLVMGKRFFCFGSWGIASLRTGVFVLATRWVWQLVKGDAACGR
jgi:hypothetical protein